MTNAPDTPPRRIGLAFGIVAFFALIAAMGVALVRGAEDVSPLVGTPAPEIRAELLAGDVPEGAHVVNFWATWCTPCLAEHPILMRMADEGTPIVGIAYRDDALKIARYLSEAGNPFSALYLDNSGNVVPDWGLRGVPETFVVEDGVITFHASGALETPLRVSRGTATD